MENFDVYVIASDRSAASNRDGDVAAVPGQSENQHSLNEAFRNFFVGRPVPAAKLEESWRNTNRLLKSIITDSVKSENQGFSLDEMEVALSITAEGNIAFVSASAEASITLKFKRR